MVEMAERLLLAVRRGEIRCCAVAIVNPLHGHEVVISGSTDSTHLVVMVGALSKLSQSILKKL